MFAIVTVVSPSIRARARLRRTNLCVLHERNPRFTKYPRLPVCSGCRARAPGANRTPRAPPAPRMSREPSWSSGPLETAFALRWLSRAWRSPSTVVRLLGDLDQQGRMLHARASRQGRITFVTRQAAAAFGRHGSRYGEVSRGGHKDRSSGPVPSAMKAVQIANQAP